MPIKPLFKIEIEEYLSPEKEDLKVRIYYTIKVKFNPNSMYVTVYETRSKAQAQLAYERLKEISDIKLYKLYTEEEDAYTMFEYADQIYKTTYVCFNQSCICGEDIIGNKRYGEFSPEGVKHDYATNIIFFYPKNHCLVKCNQVFLNGELLYNSEELSEVCKNICCKVSELDTYPDKFIKYLKSKYPEIESYECNWYTRYNIKEEL